MILSNKNKFVHIIKRTLNWRVLFLCTRAPKGNMSAKLTGARRASREDGTSLLDCTDPCRGNMPLRRHTGRVVSREKMNLFYSIVHVDAEEICHCMAIGGARIGEEKISLLDCADEIYC